jgi:hypothetical protein
VADSSTIWGLFGFDVSGALKFLVFDIVLVLGLNSALADYLPQLMRRTIFRKDFVIQRLVQSPHYYTEAWLSEIANPRGLDFRQFELRMWMHPGRVMRERHRYFCPELFYALCTANSRTVDEWTHLWQFVEKTDFAPHYLRALKLQDPATIAEFMKRTGKVFHEIM